VPQNDSIESLSRLAGNFLRQPALATKTRKYIKVLKTALINVKKAFVMPDFSTKQIRWKWTMCLGESSVDNSTALEELSVSMYAHYSMIPRFS
jgi:hypothetical protein